MASAGGGKEFKDQPWYKKIFLYWTYDASHGVADYLYEWAFDPIVIMPLAFLLLVVIAGNVDPGAVSGTLAMVVALSPVWLPIFLAVFFWVTWMHYIRYMFWFRQQFVLLEVQLPPEVEKTPLAMELFLTAMWNAGGEGTFIARLWEGGFRAVWSLEIASNEGQVKFYIHLRRGWKNIIEARLYGQFPEARITEVDDYVAKVHFNLTDYDLWSLEYMKSKPQAMPIRSYIEYGLDKNPDKPENQVDPISNLLELMGSIGEGEYMWLQIIMRAYKKDEWYGFYLDGPGHPHYVAEAKEHINKITTGAIERAQSFVEDPLEKKKVGQRGSTLLSPGERLRVEAIERALTKNMFECGVRATYLARRDKFNGINNGALIRLFDPYRYPEYNSLNVGRGTMIFDYPWQDIANIRRNRVKTNHFFRHKHRAYFYVPYDQQPTYLTTEELATIWHFPSSVVQTPAIDRVPSRRSDAPINLPT